MQYYLENNISCIKNSNTKSYNLTKSFESASGILTKFDNEKHFTKVEIIFNKNYNESYSISSENVFDDITFTNFYGKGIHQIHTNAFNKTAKTIKSFNCFDCSLDYSPPKYDIESMINQMIFLEELQIGLNSSKVPKLNQLPILKKMIIRLNVNEIPAKSFSGHNLRDLQIVLHSTENLTISSGAIQSSSPFFDVSFIGAKIGKIKKQIIQSNEKAYLTINFINCSLTGDVFESGAFNGKTSITTIKFQDSAINYLPESSFKNIISTINNKIVLNYNYHGKDSSDFDCFDCRNYWLIASNQTQLYYRNIKNAFCKHDHRYSLFSTLIIEQLTAKCK